MWPDTGNSDTLSAVFDTAGAEHKAGTYYHELDIVAGPYPRFRDGMFSAAGVDTPYTKTCGDAPTCTGTPEPLADACTGTPTDTSLTCDVDASTDECPAGCTRPLLGHSALVTAPAPERCVVTPEACAPPTCDFTAGDDASCTGTAGCTYTAPEAHECTGSLTAVSCGAGNDADGNPCAVNGAGDGCTVASGTCSLIPVGNDCDEQVSTVFGTWDASQCTAAAGCTYVPAVEESCDAPACTLTPGVDCSTTGSATCTGAATAIAASCTGTATDTSQTCDLDASTDGSADCPAGCNTVGGAGAGKAPDGDQFFMLTGANGFVYVELDAASV